MRDYAHYTRSGPKTRLLNAIRSMFMFGPLERALRRRTMGREPGSFWGRLVPPEHIYPKGSWRTVEWNGLHLRLDLSNANDHGAYFALNGTVDEPLLARLRPGQTVLDIGGNIGIYALTMAMRMKRGRVITFEPDPKNFLRLSEHLHLNPGLDVVALNVGIGAEEATHRLHHVVESNSGMNRIITGVDLEGKFPSTEVRVVPLSTALKEVALDRVDLIKIDVEGFEEAVLRGSEDIIRRFKPVLFIELDDENLRENGGSARGLVTRVEAMGYRVLDGRTERPIPQDRDLVNCQLDILCLPEG